MKSLYRILIPTLYEDTRTPVRIKHHREFDKQVLKIAGGMTIFVPTIKGLWTDKEKVYVDRTVPVDIYCTKKQIERIAKFAKQHYRQLSIMYFEITDKVYFV